MAAIIDSPRTFQVWLYTVSHAQLLLRANPTPEDGERIEVLFKGVHAMSLNTLLDGLTITETPDAPPAAGGPRRTFRLETAGARGTVVADAVFVHRDREPYHAASAFAHSLPTPGPS